MMIVIATRTVTPIHKGTEQVVAHRADIEAEWSRGGAWLTSFVLPPTAVADAVSSAVGQMDLPFLVPVSPTGVHLTVQCVTPPRPQGRSQTIGSTLAVLRFERGGTNIDSNDDQPAKQFGDIKWKPTSRGPWHDRP